MQTDPDDFERRVSPAPCVWFRACAVLCILWNQVAQSEDASQADAYFERHIRPVLVENCLECHGPDEPEAGLRLDSRGAMLHGGERGPAVVAGKASESLLLRAIRRHGELKMPPSAPLSPVQVAAIERWIDRGAVWPNASPSLAVARSEHDRFERLRQLKAEHWAFQPIRTSPSELGISDAIDFFVQRRLRESGLSPSPRADRRTLVRRLYIDLIGLPPTFQQVEEFCANESRSAFAMLVDELLSRQEYGQRWARHWLDVARYADTTGYQEGAERQYPFAWTYRDYVIRSFNEDTPFNDFVMEQLAADQLNLDSNTQWKLAAMGFLTMGPRFNYVRHEIIDDRIDVVTRGLLGLTVTCARCHDHKYDPVLAEDYYGLYGVFASSYEPLYTDLPRIGPSQGEFGRYREFRGKLASATRSFEQFHSRIHKRIQHETRAQAADYLRYLIQLTVEHRSVVQPRLETGRGVIRGPTPYGPGTIVRWQHYIDSRRNDDPVFGFWKTAIATPPGELRKSLLDLIDEHPEMNSLLRTALKEARPRSMLEVASVYGALLERAYTDWKSCLAEHPEARRFSDDVHEQLREVLYGAESPLVMNEDEAHDCYTSAEFDQFVPRKREVDSLFAEYQDVAAPRAMIMRDRDVLHDPRVFARGQATRPGDFVSRRFLTVLSEVSDPSRFGDNSGRLELARAIVHPSNPLTPRVIVNRVWHWHFGRGLVATPSDFGTRAAAPSHPELLDRLAADFVEHGWSLKRLHKQIVMSSTWQQISIATEAAAERDPDNRLLSHMSRRRLSFEALRDSMLSVAGRLERDSKGPPVDDLGANCRSLFLLVNRDDLDDVFATFDFPSPDISLANRAETTVPQQSLFMMNSDFVDAIVEHIASAHLEPASAQKGQNAPAGSAHSLNPTPFPIQDTQVRPMIKRLYQRILARLPRAEEISAAEQGFDFRHDRHAARDFAHVLIMSNAFLFVD